MAEVFTYQYQSIKTENPESGVRIQMGGSYVFSTPSPDPDQRKFTLKFNAMRYYFDEDDELDETINEPFNMLSLIKFYGRHKLYKSFQYQHPVHGLMEVKFSKPLVEEEVEPGGFGVVKPFDIELIEIP